MPSKKQETAVRIEIDGTSYEIDPAKLTWGELAEVETYFDRAIDEINFESARGTLILAYLAKKRKNPRTTLADIEGLGVEDIKEAVPDRPTSTRKSAGSQS